MSVQSIERAFALLEVLSAGPAGVSEVAAAAGLPKSTAARLLGTLEEQRAVERLPGDTRYRLGPVIADLAIAITPTRSLVAVARPQLVRLTEATGEAAGLSVADGYDVLYIGQIDGPNPVQVRDWTGARIPMHAVPSGIVLLAEWPEVAVARYLDRELVATAPRTVVDPDGIRSKLEAARQGGHAWFYEEFADGINSVAAPLRDEHGAVVAALHVHGPAYRFPAPNTAADVAGRVMDAARRVSAQLGWSSPE